jgi:hypothetical protein
MSIYPVNLGNCCGLSIPGIRKITLPDGYQFGLGSLDTVYVAVFKGGMVPDYSTAIELVTSEKTYGINALALSNCASLTYYNG